MLATDPEELSSTMEQVAHHLEEKGLQIRPLHMVPLNQEVDPEEDPGSIASIYTNLMSGLPSRGLSATEMKSKVDAIREIAVDVGLANIGVLKPTSSAETSSLSTLRKFIDINPSLKVSEAAKFLLGKWGEVPEVEKPRQTAMRKRRRVRLDEPENTMERITMSQGNMEQSGAGVMSSQGVDGYAGLPMSQPERGKHGVRVLRKKVRRSGF